MSIIAALYPGCIWAAFSFLAAYSVGRILFSLGYTKAGPNGRIVGAIIMDLAILGQLVTAIVSIAKLIKMM